MMLTEPSLRTFLRFLTARRTLIVAPLSRGVMSVFCNVIKPQGLEPFQFWFLSEIGAVLVGFHG